MKKIQIFVLLLLTLSVISCKKSNKGNDPLPSWKETNIKKSIIHFVDTAVKIIPIVDRIAVFDMDGTIACETPLWFEMYCAVAGLNDQSAKDSSLMKYPEYQYAKKLAVNPADTSVLNNWSTSNGNYIDSMVFKAFIGVDNEKYVSYCTDYLNKTKSKDFTNLNLADMFYQPMIELIEYLQKNKFSVYVVSGSMQGVIWSVCPQEIGFDRDHLIGTRQIMNPTYPNSTVFTIQKGIFQPKNDKDGKTLNINSHIGKVPVFAFGNTNGDFGMFHYTSTSTYPHVCYLLNHDDKREYIYPPYHGAPVENWQDSLTNNGWNLVNMSENFITIWKTKK